MINLADSLFAKDVNRLLDLLRQDNPIIGLNVRFRELSWSHFLSWLFDPGIHPKVSEIFLRTLLDATHEDASRSVLEIWESIPEYGVVSGGRIDLVVKFNAGPLKKALMIETKILAEEREGQVSNYMKDLQKQEKVDEVIPLLISIWEKPEKCSLEEAKRWGRPEVKAWFEAAVTECKSADLAWPRLVDDYLELFEIFGLIRDLRDDNLFMDWLYSKADTSDYKTNLLKRWIPKSDLPFFRQVLDFMGERLEQMGFDECGCWGAILGRNEGLDFGKRGWRVAGDKNKGLDVLYQSRYPGKLFVLADLQPYDPATRHQFKNLLDKKKQLIDVLRNEFKKEVKLGEIIDNRRVHDSSLENTLQAVTFTPKNFQSPAECAKYYLMILEMTSRLIDGVVERVRENKT
jgi:hypothetical protein